MKIAKALDRAADTLGINFIGGFGALVQKGMTAGAQALIDAIPQALSETKRVCSSVNVASTKAGINMDAVRRMGSTIKQLAYLTRDEDSTAAPNSWCSPTCRRTTRLWRARFTVPASLSA